MIGGLEAQIGQRLVVSLPQLAVDLEEALQQIALSPRLDLVDYFFKELIVDIEVARAELLREDFEQEARRALRAGILREEDRHGIGRQIPRIREEREALRLRSGQRPGAETVRSRADAGIGPVAGDARDRELAAALVDVVLEAVRRELRRRRHHFEL